MLSFTGGLKVFVALEPCDMRAGANTLSGRRRDEWSEAVLRGRQSQSQPGSETGS